MQHTILTMSRGDAPRLKEWVDYHCWLGFDTFHIILDNPVDDSEHIIRRLKVPARLIVDVRGAVGDYYDGLSRTERWGKVLDWRKAHGESLKAQGLPVVDPQTVRQHRYFSAALAGYEAAGNGWVAVIDVDEFIAITGNKKIQDLTTAVTVPRLRLHSFNFDTSNHDPSESFLTQHTMRWSREDIVGHGKGWERRVKTIARHDALLPFASVHPISKGPYSSVDSAIARLHHYRTPDQGLPIPYSVNDTTLAELSQLRTYLGDRRAL